MEERFRKNHEHLQEYPPPRYPQRQGARVQGARPGHMLLTELFGTISAGNRHVVPLSSRLIRGSEAYIYSALEVLPSSGLAAAEED